MTTFQYVVHFSPKHYSKVLEIIRFGQKFWNLFYEDFNFWRTWFFFSFEEFRDLFRRVLLRVVVQSGEQVEGGSEPHHSVPDWGQQRVGSLAQLLHGEGDQGLEDPLAPLQKYQHETQINFPIQEKTKKINIGQLVAKN